MNPESSVSSPQSPVSTVRSSYADKTATENLKIVPMENGRFKVVPKRKPKMILFTAPTWEHAYMEARALEQDARRAEGL